MFWKYWKMFWKIFKIVPKNAGKVFRNISGVFRNIKTVLKSVPDHPEDFWNILKHQNLIWFWDHFKECSGAPQKVFQKFEFETFQECSRNVKTFLNSVLELLVYPENFKCSGTLRRFSKVFRNIKTVLKSVLQYCFQKCSRS